MNTLYKVIPVFASAVPAVACGFRCSLTIFCRDLMKTEISLSMQLGLLLHADFRIIRVPRDKNKASGIKTFLGHELSKVQMPSKKDGTIQVKTLEFWRDLEKKKSASTLALRLSLKGYFCTNQNILKFCVQVCGEQQGEKERTGRKGLRANTSLRP